MWNDGDLLFCTPESYNNINKVWMSIGNSTIPIYSFMQGHSPCDVFIPFAAVLGDSSKISLNRSFMCIKSGDTTVWHNNYEKREEESVITIKPIWVTKPIKHNETCIEDVILSFLTHLVIHHAKLNAITYIWNSAMKLYIERRDFIPL